MKICALASGSKGNAYLVGSGEAWLLIDDGLTWRELGRRLKAAFPEPSTFNLQSALLGILVTHNHTDHIGGLAMLHKHLPEVPIFANAMTAEASAAMGVGLAEEDFTIFENGQEFTCGPFTVSSFSIPHDVPDPVGYLIRAGDETYFHATDVGTPLDAIGAHLACADYALLESNHDVMMLRSSGRAPSLVNRILGPRGHLSNYQAAELIEKFLPPRLKVLALAHLSEDCNAPRLAEEEMRAALVRKGRAELPLHILAQNTICWISRV